MGEKSWEESLESNHGKEIMGGIIEVELWAGNHWRIIGVESWESKSWEESLELNHGKEIMGGIIGVESWENNHGRENSWESVHRRGFMGERLGKMSLDAFRSSGKHLGRIWEASLDI